MGAEIEKSKYFKIEQNMGEHTKFRKTGEHINTRGKVVGIRDGVCNSLEENSVYIC